MWSLALTVLALFSAANAHFMLLYPQPRGAFVEDNEPNFCDGYTNAVSNRSTFPLTGGVFTLLSEHADFTVGVLLSTVQNPTSFDNFSVGGQPQLVRQYAQEADPGTFCIPLDIAAGNIAGAVDGANVTIQIVFSGGDGNLYQCADLTLSSSFTTPSSVSCTNTTTSTTSSSAASPSSTTGSSGSSRSLGQMKFLSGSVLLAALGLGVAFSL